MIRHYDGTNGEAIAKQARGGRIFSLHWTWRGHRIVRTKKEGRHVLQVWKRWYEELGWRVVSGRGYEGYVAYHPEASPHDWNRHGPDSLVRTIGLHEYDPTLRRVYEEVKT